MSSTPLLKKKQLLELYESSPIVRSVDQQLFIDTFNSVVHQRDGMNRSSALYYFSTGLDAIKNMELALNRAGRKAQPPKRVLDFPCGFGRVTRWMEIMYPNAKIFASDLMEMAVDFCGTTFRCETFETSKTIKETVLPGNLDIIWVGSLFTHLAGTKVRDYLKLMSKSLNDQGVIVFTAHGAFVRNRMVTRKKTYRLGEKRLVRIVDNYDNNGFGFAPYDGFEDYGISLMRYEWLYNLQDKVDGLELDMVIPRGWVNHQDVVIFKKKK